MCVMAHFRQDCVFGVLCFREVASLVSLQRSHFMVMFRVVTSRSSMPYSSMKGKDIAVPLSAVCVGWFEVSLSFVKASSSPTSDDSSPESYV